MAIECELKFGPLKLENLARILQEKGVVSTGRYLEVNRVFDREDHSLRRRGVLLRLRERKGEGLITVKCATGEADSGVCKLREELQTTVGDVDILAQALEVLGFKEVLGYEKVREKCSFMGCVLCLDRLPFGEFLEIEGDESSMTACARELGLGVTGGSSATYHQLNREYRERAGLEPDESFVFPEQERAAIIRELSKD